MPSRAKRPECDANFYAKEVIKMLGWIEGASGREAWYEDIDYANDRTPDMPMNRHERRAAKAKHTRR